MSKLSRLLAKRYLFSSKSHSVINIISSVSAFAISIPVAAMVILLSVSNGFGDLIKDLYKDFDPDIVISSSDGRVFDSTALNRARLLDFSSVQQVSMVVEESALLEYRGRQSIATLRGVDSFYQKIIPIEGMIKQGKYDLVFGDMEQIVVGQGIAYTLGIRTSFYDPVKVYYPKRGRFNSMIPSANYNVDRVFPVGVYVLDADTDSKYAIVPIEFAQRVFDYEGRYTDAMIKVKSGLNHDDVRNVLAEELGDKFIVQTRQQMKASLYKIIVYEKWALFFIILLVLIIASFSVIGSMVMLIIEKNRDIQTLRALGADVNFVRSVFINEGMLISVIGAIIGLTIGLLFCWLQITFGFIQLPAGTFLVSSYPLVVKSLDIISIVVAFFVVTYVICRLTVVKMVSKNQ